MKRIFFVFPLATALTIALVWALSARGQSESEYVEGEVIVKFHEFTRPEDIQGVKLDLDISVKKVFRDIGAELWELKDMTVDDAIELLQNDRRVRYAEPNYLVQLHDVFPNDPRFSELWGMHNIGQTGGTADADIDAPEAWEMETGNEVLIGVIDTGVDRLHPDLIDNMYTNPGEIPGNNIDDDGNGFIDDVHGWDFVNNDNDPYDDYGHGTHVAGTIAGVGNNGIGVAGVCWTARIMGIKWIAASGWGTVSDAILSIEYATMMGTKATNNSWGFGTSYSQALKDAIEAAGDAGSLFIASSGNDSRDTDLAPHYPSSYDLDNIISIASTTHNDGLSSFSNWGRVSVDLGAPGSDVLSTLPGNRYGLASGTSMAAPHVTGAVALLLSAAPALTHLEVKEIIMSSVDPIPALMGRSVSDGRLNVYNMLSGLDSIPPARVNDLTVTSTGSNTVTLDWTATGDDSTAGTARAYDLRYSTSQIYWSNFDSATVVPDLPEPQASGTPETFQVTGLDFNTTYYFGMVVHDEQGNVSWLSNLPSGTTLGVPQLSFAPGSFADDLFTGGTSVHLLTIRNVADGTLDFTFPGSGGTGAAAAMEAAAAAFPSWLRANPNSGRVYAGDSMIVEIVFDATGLYGGDYSEDVILETNDPTQLLTPIPVTLHVTNAPDIAVSEESIDFGPRYIGTCVTDTLVVTNIGTEILVASGVSIDNPEYSADPSGFVLGIGQSRVLGVTFCPLTAGMSPGTLTIASNDPDHPAMDVPLAGEGVEPPIIVVTPESVEDSLYTGGTSTQLLTVQNIGDSDLDFAIDIEAVESLTLLSASRSYRLDGPPQGSSRDRTPRYEGAAPASGPLYSEGHAPAREINISEVRIANVLATDLKILLLHAADVTEIQGLLLAFPDISVVDVFDGEYGTPTLEMLLEYDSVILIVNSHYADPAAIGNVLADYVDAGGGVVMTVASFIAGWDVQGRFATGGYYPFTVGSGPIAPASLGAFDPTHPIMEGVITAWGDLLGATSLASGAEWVADWDNGQPFIATQGEGVVGVNIFVSNGGYWTGDIPLILHNAAAWSAGAYVFLSADPTEGVVPPSMSVDIQLTFDATGLFGGGYDANLAVASNDPVTPVVDVPAHLHVTGAPDIAVSDTLLDYGPVFVGAVVKDTLVVSNVGTDLLTVSDVSTDHGDYTVDVTNFALNPGDNQAVTVSFAPTTAAPIPGSLTIASDDPDEPVFTVILAGEGLEPPVISVTPDSLSDSLYTGANSSQTLTIANSGGADLTWDVRTVSTEGILVQTYTLTAPVADVVNPETGTGPDPESVRTSSITAELRDLTDVHILWDLTHGQFSPSGWSVIIADVTARGATVTENYDPITPALLAAYDILWLTDMGSWTPAEISMVQAWLVAGGAMLIESDQSQYEVNDILSGLGSGITYLTSSGTPGTTSTIYPHETTEDVGSVYVDNPLAQLAVTTPAGRLVDDVGGHPNCAYSEVVGGRIFAAGDEMFHDYSLGVADNQLFGNQVVDWLAMGASWLSVTPTEGTVPPGGAEMATVTFDAAGLNGGDYEADIVFSNNDPLRPQVTVPAYLHVTGAPDIAVSDTLLDYGPVFIGAVVKDTLVVSNVGTDLLTVSDVSTDHGDYTVDVTNFALNPGDNRAVTVSFAPTTAAPIPGSLTITSDDPDEPVVTVTLAGEGLEPPVISVTPDSMSADLFTGGTTTDTLTISNAGSSDLEWAIDIEGVGLGTVTFTKADWADPTDPANQDCMTPNVCITRASYQGIYNAATETGYSYGSPDDTEWAFGYTADLDPSDYNIWVVTVGHYPPGMVGQPMSLHLISDDIYFDIMFHSWTMGGAGGGFSYTRTDAAPRWLEVSEESGVVPAGSQSDIEVTFNASGLFGGDYDANLRIVNNDPITPEVVVPAHLHVTGAPDIVVSDSLLDYGAHFVGAVVLDTVVIANQGTDLLTVSDISIDQGDFAVDVTSVALNPGENQEVVVTFAPASTGVQTATLTITSDDPDKPVVTVALEGEGLEPPVISVAPEALSDSLFTGESSTHLLTISNTGASDLAFNIFFDINPTMNAAPPAASATGALAVPAAGAGKSGGPTWSQPRDPVVVTQDPTPNETDPTTDVIEIAAEYGGDHLYFGITDRGEIMPFQYPTGNEHLMRGAYIAGYTVVYRFGGTDYVRYAGFDSRSGIDPVSVTELVNDPVRVVVEVVTRTTDNRVRITRRFTFMRNDKYIAVQTTLENTSGGQLDDVVFKSFADWDVDETPSSDNWDYDLTLNMVYAWENKYTAIGSAKTPDLMDIDGWGDYSRRETFVDYPVGPVFSVDGLEILHYELGDLSASGSFSLSTAYAAGDDLPDLQQGIQRGLESWLELEPVSGIVPPGESADVIVTFDATGLDGGDYDADIVVASNDPVTPEVTVPAHLKVTAIPDIAVSDTLLNFGSLFIGASSNRTVIVSNTGNDYLVVSDITSSNPDVSTYPSSFTVPMNGGRSVVVTFAPTDSGAISDTLTIVSNDPDEGELEILVVGEGLIPPEVVVSPDSLSEALFSGDTSTQMLTISNPGGSLLTFNVGTVTDSVAVALSESIQPPTNRDPLLPGLSARGDDRDLPKTMGSFALMRGANGLVLDPISGAEPTVSWLSLSPTSGAVDPDSSVVITVSFDAGGLIGGLYYTDIIISTNVPAEPTVTVPVELDVTGAPAIVVSDTLLDFGVVFVGFSETRSITVRNTGTDVLTVTDISADDPTFSPSPTSFDLAPGGVESVSVTHTPAHIGPITAVLTIASNDPNEGMLEIDLVAEATEPPVVSVSTDSIVVSLDPGTTYLDSITLSNTGGSDLVWGVEVSSLPSALPPLTTAAPGKYRGGNGTTFTPVSREASDVDILSKTGAMEPLGLLDILWHGDHGFGGISLWSIIISDLTSRGATVTESNDLISPALLSGVDVLWFGDRSGAFSPSEMSAIGDWLSDGGSLLIEADSDESGIVYTSLLGTFGSGIAYSYFNGVAGVTETIFPHEMTVGVNEIYLLNPNRTLYTGGPLAAPLVADWFNETIVGYDLVGGGRVVVMADQLFHDVAIDVADNRIFANQVFTWFGVPSWLGITPTSGTVAAGDSVALEVTIDALLLPPGTYEQYLKISSNDPVTPVVTVTVSLHVDTTVTLTAIDPEDQLPVRYELRPNYPNPFNPTTTIAYDLPQRTTVRLQIYDVKGRKVRELVNGVQPAGRHDALWDGRDSSSNPVASGVYFYKLIAGDFVETRRMVLLK